MQLRRYKCKEKGKGALFGNGSEVHTYDFDWMLRDDQIGIIPCPSTEAESFYGGFLGSDNTGLVITRTPRLCIARADDDFGRIVQGSGRAGEGAEISRLIEMLTSGEGAHAFLTAQKPHYFAAVLTFSRNAPSPDTYAEIQPISLYVR